MFKGIILTLAALIAFAPAIAVADTQIVAVGSTALLPLVKQAAAEYQAQHPDVKISVSGGGSYTGLEQARAGNANLGDSDVIAPGNYGLVDHKVAVVGFAIAANNGDGIKNLTAKQVRDVFAGRVKNWKQVGGADQAIVVINRPKSSGTRAVFTKTIMGASKIDDSGLTQDSSGAVITMVAQTPGAVTYVAVPYTKDKPVTVVRINGVAPTDNDIMTGRYPIWSYEHIFTKGKASPEIESFIRFIATNSAVEKLGYIPVARMKVAENNR